MNEWYSKISIKTKKMWHEREMTGGGGGGSVDDECVPRGGGELAAAHSAAGESSKLLPTALRVVAPGILGDVDRRQRRLATGVGAIHNATSGPT